MKNLNFPGLPRILIIDDEATQQSLRVMFQGEGVSVDTASSMETARDIVDRKNFDVVLIDAKLAGSDGLATLSMLRRSSTSPTPAEFVLIAGYGAAANAVDAMRHGASDVLEKPLSRDRVFATIRRCLESRQLRNELAWSQGRVRDLTSTEIIGLSPAIRLVQERIEQVAQAVDTTVLVTGPMGSGKELIARCIHDRGVRRHGPFVAVNCAALQEDQLEAELFGCEAGVGGGGSLEAKDGVFAMATGGTLYLDEIGRMGKALQAKLFRVLQERTFRRVGGVQDITADVRIVASTHRDLRAEVESGNFREDLFYRLNVMSVAVPSLADRQQDVPLLAHFFLDQLGRRVGKSLTGFTEEATETLCEYSWPGNVRELRNAVEHAAIACSGGMIDECHLPKFTGGRADGSDAMTRNVIVLDGADCSIRQLESQLVRQVLDQTRWNISKAASLLGINRTTLYNKIRLYEIGKRPSRQEVSVS